MNLNYQQMRFYNKRHVKYAIHIYCGRHDDGAVQNNQSSSYFKIGAFNSPGDTCVL